MLGDSMTDYEPPGRGIAPAFSTLPPSLAVGRRRLSLHGCIHGRRQRSTSQCHSCYEALTNADSDRVYEALMSTKERSVKRELPADRYLAQSGVPECLYRTTGLRAFVPLLG